MLIPRQKSSFIIIIVIIIQNSRTFWRQKLKTPASIFPFSHYDFFFGKFRLDESVENFFNHMERNYGGGKKKLQINRRRRSACTEQKKKLFSTSNVNPGKNFRLNFKLNYFPRFYDYL